MTIIIFCSRQFYTIDFHLRQLARVSRFLVYKLTYVSRQRRGNVTQATVLSLRRKRGTGLPPFIPALPPRPLVLRLLRRLTVIGWCSQS